MNYTENYHLPQWAKSDRILMEDFNRMCADIEAGLTGNAEDARAATEAAGNAAAAALEAAGNAADAAAKAQAKADAAYCPDYAPYAAGTYTGTGASLTITTGFQPRFVIVSGIKSPDPDFSLAAIAARGTMSSRVSFTATGFLVHPMTWSGGTLSTPVYPDLSKANTTYSYIAFR